MPPQKLLLFDTASLYFRAFFGLPSSLRSPDGRPTNAVRGLADFLARFLETYRPTHVACCWDVDWRPGWRVALVPTYKTHRLADPADAALPPRALTPTRIERVEGWEVPDEETPDELEAQVPTILRLLTLAGIPVVGADHYEADDVIGTLASHAPMPVDVVTGDRDLFQLVDDEREIRVLATTKGVAKHAVLDDAAVEAAYGVRPQQYVDLALLRGDASDGLPGVKGIGEKTAASLLRSYGDLEGILRAASDPGSPLAGGVRSKLAAAIDYLAAAGDVVRVARDVPSDVGYDDLALRPVPDPAAWDAFVTEFDLGSPAARLAAAIGALA